MKFADGYDFSQKFDNLDILFCLFEKKDKIEIRTLRYCEGVFECYNDVESEFKYFCEVNDLKGPYNVYMYTSHRKMIKMLKKILISQT